ncbi:hypothetical protein [Micromonospora sp. AMSO31t]|uniref:hypothetical protein n=1 Tax=Micromonospora sp. AMSO31t TaxID=2650566 RepID=UPI001788E2D8|nr:hypothetical protein [Micromonospora sp. AMSO31t]
MIDRGSGRTSGLTDWRLMDVLSMWACLQDQDTTGQWKQVAGWRKVCDLALAHVSRLREYRRGLAEAWPPETNAAARAYLGELDQLIDQVQRTHDAAAANYDALAAATRAIGSTRAELKPLFDEYAEKVRQKQAYEAVLADPKAVAGSRLPEKPPVTDADLEQLNVRARGLMTGLSGELQQAQVMLRQPPPRPVPKVDENIQTSGVDGSAPLIPPIVPVPVSIQKPSSITRPSATAAPTAMPQASGVGPILGGTGAGLASAPPLTVTPTPSTSANIPPTTGVTGPPPPVAGGAASFPTPGFRRGEVARGSGGERFTPPTPPSRSVPSGGLIGGPYSGLSQPSSGASPRRVNPVGGVIGGGAAGTAPAGAAGSRPGTGRYSQHGNMGGLHPIGGSPATSGTNSLPPSGRPGRRSDDEIKGRDWDPHNPWKTDEGVTPIVRAPEEEGPIDPGPAIGFDR